MTAPEMAWMQAMILKDDLDDYQEKLEFIEYLASFTNPEAVQKIQHDRANTSRMSDEDLMKTLQEISGRNVPGFQENVSG